MKIQSWNRQLAKGKPEVNQAGVSTYGTTMLELSIALSEIVPLVLTSAFTDAFEAASQNELNIL